MRTQRSPKLPAGVSLRDAGTNSHSQRHVPTRFLLSLILMDLTIQPIVLAWGPWTNFANAIQRLVA